MTWRRMPPRCRVSTWKTASGPTGWMKAASPGKAAITKTPSTRPEAAAWSWVQSFGALKDAPGDVTLSFYNGMTKERFDQITLTLSPKEGQIT